MPIRYASDPNGRQQFRAELWPALIAHATAVQVAAGRTPQIPDLDTDLRAGLGLSDATIALLGVVLRTQLQAIGESPAPISDADYQSAVTPSELLRLLWWRTGGSQDWP